MNTPWKLNAVSYNASVDGGQTTGTITASGTGIGAKVSGNIFGSSCSMTMGGTKSAPASASFLYDNNSHLLAITGAKNFQVLNSTCSAAWSVGDAVTSLTCPSDSYPPGARASRDRS